MLSKERLQKLAGILNIHSTILKEQPEANGTETAASKEERFESDIPTVNTINGIKIVNYGDVLDYAMPRYWDDFDKHLKTKGKHGYPSYDEASKVVEKWAREHDGIVYSWGGNTWLSSTETALAVKQAKKENKSLVVMEYLS